MIRRWQERLQLWFEQGLRLLHAAQIESLGGSRGGPVSLLSPPAKIEESPYYPKNWSDPFVAHVHPLTPWSSAHWGFQSTGQVVLGGGRRDNYEHFLLHPPHRLMALASGVAGMKPDWRVPQWILQAMCRGFASQREGTLPCSALDPKPKAEQSAQKPTCRGGLNLYHALESANRALLSVTQPDLQAHPLGAFVAAHVCCNWLWFARLGPLRLYRWRNGQIEHLTHESESVSSPEEPQRPPLQRDLEYQWFGNTPESRRSSFLGLQPSLQLPIAKVPLVVGDMFVLCSRGLFSTLSSQVMQQVLTEHQQRVDLSCQRMADIAWNTRYQSADITLLLTHLLASRNESRQHFAQRWGNRWEDVLFEP